jgi:hypothetical protein
MRGRKERSQGRNELGGIALISSQVWKAMVVLFTSTRRAGGIGVLKESVEDDVYPLLGERHQFWGVQELPRATHVSEEWYDSTRTRLDVQAKGGTGECAGLRRGHCGEQRGRKDPDESTGTRWVGRACGNESIVEGKSRQFCVELRDADPECQDRWSRDGNHRH